MTKKHFEMFARTLNAEVTAARNDHDNVTVEKAMYAATVFARIAAHDNPRFDRERFMKACGLR